MTPRQLVKRHGNNLISWGQEIEPNTIEQALATSRLPFIAGHVALMPDAHLGMGSTVGSVIPTQGAIIPAAIGVDIGCGMLAAETDLTADGLPDDLGKLHSWIAKVVPAGLGKGHDQRIWQQNPKMPVFKYDLPGLVDLSNKLQHKVIEQLGTLGSGNHFVEVCLDERDRVWVVLHSGSRGVGNEIAKVHIDGAKKMMKRYFIDLEDPDLAYLVSGTSAFNAYINDMLWAQEYARLNRDRMMDAVLTQLFAFINPDQISQLHGVGHEVSRINCHHNFTQMENHFGKNIWITRKGAIKADVGDMGVIPGSMGTRSYIVSGLGNTAAYNSCSHGAGRRLSRTKARAQLTVESLQESMAGKTWNDRDAKALLDEHPDSYKDIDQVMADQRDLVKIEHTLHQILNYKGV